MKEVLPMLQQETLQDMPNVIFSQASADGLTRSDLQEYLTTSQSGQQAYHANHSASPENNSEKPTNDTCYRTISHSLSSADLQRNLANKLQARLSTDGHVIYKQQWKQKVTPSGIMYLAHTASVHSTKDKGCTGLPTPTVSDATAGKRIPTQKAGPVPGLIAAAQIMSWPTTAARDWKNGKSNLHGKNSRPLNEVAMLACLGTPRVTTNNGIGSEKRGADGKARLEDQACGAILTGSNAETTNPGQLNPDLPRWLMGYPPEWCDCAVMAMQSFRK